MYGVLPPERALQALALIHHLVIGESVRQLLSACWVCLALSGLGGSLRSAPDRRSDAPVAKTSI